MKATLPQIIMLNHAAWVNHERMERRIKAGRNTTEAAETIEEAQYHGRPITELNSTEFAGYMADLN